MWLVLLILIGHIKNVLNKVAHHISGARFVVLKGHVENVFEYGRQPHVWGLKLILLVGHTKWGLDH